MIHIKELMNTLPIKYDNKTLRIIDFKDISWYLNNCRKEYYEKFMDFKFSSDISYDKLEILIYKLIVGYKIKSVDNTEVRLVLTDTENKIIGGATLFEESKEKAIELAYFVLPEYSSKGICTEMLINVMNTLAKSKIPFNKFIITSREDNIASICVAKKLNFKEVKRVKGKYKQNIIFETERR